MSFKYSYTVEIDVSKKKVMESLSDFSNWKKWVQWFKYNSPRSNVYTDGKGEGSILHWVGELIGEGKYEMINVDEDRIDLKLYVSRPRKNVVNESFILEEIAEDKTKVTWEIQNVDAYFESFVKKKRLPYVRDDYDVALLMLKELLEEGSVTSDIKFGGVIKTPKFKYIYSEIRGKQEELQGKITNCFTFLKGVSKGSENDKFPPFTMYNGYDTRNQEFSFKVCVPIKKRMALPEGVSKGKSKRSWCLKLFFNGKVQYSSVALMVGYYFLYSKRIPIRRSVKPLEIHHNLGEQRDIEMLIPISSNHRYKAMKYLY